jgi:hypothetical protein
MPRIVIAAGLVGLGAAAAPGGAAAGPVVHCDNAATSELAIDGRLDDWPGPIAARAGSAPDAALELRCTWDGEALGLALDVKDDRVVRVRGKGHEDRVELSVSAAGGRPLAITAAPGNAVAPSRVTVPGAPRGVSVADSLQPHGFSLEARIPASAIPGLSASAPELALAVAFHDADLAAGGDERAVELAVAIELADRRDLLDDFLRTTHLGRGDLRLDRLVEVDPDRRGPERVVAGGAVIGVLTDRFAYVTLPVARPADVKRVELLALGPRDQQVIAAVITQTGNGGSRDLLLLWTVWSGQLQPLAQIEVKKQLAAKRLESSWRVVKGRRRGPELWVEPRPAVGFTAETWNEAAADDADPIALPWDGGRGGVAYALVGADLVRRDLPPGKR